MLYCKKCKLAYNEKINKCKICGDELTSNIKDDDIVFIARENKENVKQIEDILNLKGIKFIEQIDKTDFYNHNDYFNIYVLYKDFETCKKLLENIGKDYQHECVCDEMTPLKRNIIRAVSGVLFILVVCLVVFAVDYIAAFVKGVI